MVMKSVDFRSSAYLLYEQVQKQGGFMTNLHTTIPQIRQPFAIGVLCILLFFCIEQKTIEIQQKADNSKFLERNVQIDELKYEQIKQQTLMQQQGNYIRKLQFHANEIHKHMNHLNIEIDDYRYEANELQNELNQTKIALNDLKVLKSDQRNAIINLESKVSELANGKLNLMNTSIQYKIYTLEQKVNELENVRSELENKLHEAENHLEQTRTGTMFWKPSVSEVLNTHINNEICSPAFSSDKYGYRLQTCLHLYDDYFRVGIKFLPGEYDSLLQWPFAGAVHIKLIDQSEQGRDIECTFQGSDLEPFSRPRGNESSPSYYVLISLTEFSRVVLNFNAIFVKVNVEMCWYCKYISSQYAVFFLIFIVIFQYSKTVAVKCVNVVSNVSVIFKKTQLNKQFIPSSRVKVDTGTPHTNVKEQKDNSKSD